MRAKQRQLVATVDCAQQLSPAKWCILGAGLMLCAGKQAPAWRLAHLLRPVPVPLQQTIKHCGCLVLEPSCQQARCKFAQAALVVCIGCVRLNVSHAVLREALQA